MAFSFADLGYWRLAIIAFCFEAFHLLLIGRWPEIRGSRLGPRPISATVFMALEFFALAMALAAAIGASSRILKHPQSQSSKVAWIGISALGLLGLFFLIWEY